MFEFNPDGSLKLPNDVAKKKENDQNKMKMQRCIKIEREVVSTRAPKKCMLHMQISKVYTDTRFINTIYENFRKNSSVPTKLNMVTDKEFNIEVGTDFKRCTDCARLRNDYVEYTGGNVIDKKGSCTFGSKNKNFSYEDYFD